MKQTYLEDEYRQVFRNLGFPDRVAGFQPEVFVRTAKENGVRIVAVDVRTQCYSLYDTKVYVKYPVLGKRDLVKETVEACRKYGLKFLGYVSPLRFEPWYRDKEEWQQRWADGRVAIPSGEGSNWKTKACWNTSFGKHRADELIEIVQTYHPDGLYIDGLLPDGDGCYCPACREKFQVEFGRPMPEKQDWDSAEWYEFLDWRYRQVEEFAKLLDNAVHSIDPKIEIIFNCPHAWCGWYSGQSYRPTLYLDRVGTEVQTDGVAATHDSQRFWSLMTHVVYRVLVTRMLGGGRKSHCYTYFTPEVPEASAAVEVNSVLASGGVPCIHNCTSYLGNLMKRIEEAEPYLADSEEVRFVGVVFSDVTRDACYREDDKRFFAEIHGIFRPLMESHVPFQFVGDHQIDENDLAGFRLLILPNVTTLSDQGWNNLKAFVEKGGRVLATYKSGLLDRYGHSHGKELLWNGSGLNYVEDINTERPYWVNENGLPQSNIPAVPNQYLLFTPARRKEFNLDFSSFSQGGGGWVEYEIPGYLEGNLHISCEAVHVKADKTWETILPFGFKKRSGDEMIQAPGLARKKIGRGYLYYLNFDIGQMFSQGETTNSRQFLKNLVLKAAGALPVDVEAPDSVYVSLWRQKKEKRTVLHLVNDLSSSGRLSSRRKMQMDYVPVSAKLTLRPSGIKSVKQAVGDSNMKSRKTKQGIEVTLEGITERTVLVIQ